MDELPESAKRLLALARTADEPSDAARQRVRRGVAIAIGAGGALGAGSAASRVSASSAAAGKAGVISSTGAKLALVCATVATVGAVAWVQRPQPAPAARHAVAAPHTAAAPRIVAPPTQPAPAPVTQEAAAPAPVPAIEAPAPEAKQAQPRVHATQPVAHRSAAAEQSAPDQSLRAEMTLLSEASVALDRGDLARARAALAAHHVRFASGQLKQERRGLEVLTRCVSNQAGAQAAARAYLRTAPDAVLAARIAGACKLEQTP